MTTITSWDTMIVGPTSTLVFSRSQVRMHRFYRSILNKRRCEKQSRKPKKIFSFEFPIEKSWMRCQALSAFLVVWLDVSLLLAVCRTPAFSGLRHRPRVSLAHSRWYSSIRQSRWRPDPGDRKMTKSNPVPAVPLQRLVRQTANFCSIPLLNI